MFVYMMCCVVSARACVRACVGASTTSPDLALMYSVVYNKTVLNNAGLLGDNTTFTNQLMNSAANVSSSNYAYDGYSLDGNATMSSMTSVIADGKAVE